jgi:Cu2+-exporting ATPase
MTNNSKSNPQIIHKCRGRVRFRWKKLYHPHLNPDYLEAWLEAMPGINEARINPQACSVTVSYSGSAEMTEKIRQRLVCSPEESFSRKSPAPAKRKFVDSAAAGTIATVSPFLPIQAKTALAYATGISPILRGLDTLINRGLKVQVLDMSTIGLSLLRKDYNTATSIAAMIVVGDYLKQITEDRTNNLLRSLMSDPVEKVTVCKNEQLLDVPFEKVEKGDTVVCTAGEIIPVDGVITEGEVLINQTSITGEARPLHCKTGDQLISGYSVIEGSVKIKAVRVGSETSIKRITGIMENSLMEKSDVELESDRLADKLAPISFGTGAALFALTGDADKALSALTVDYACAVKFPTPVVIKTSMYTAAKSNVIIKSGSALMKIAKADTVVFDKTGTLTKGEINVAEVIPCAEITKHEILRYAAAAENRSFHPVGKAIITESERLGLTIPDSLPDESRIAHGVCTSIEGKTVRVGSRHYIHDDCGIDCSCISNVATDLRKKGYILVYVAVDQSLAGIITMQDEIRPEAQNILEKLKNDGINKIIILTGDHRETATAFMEKLPAADSICWDLKPDEKALMVKRLKNKGHKIIFVGDGINDAPSLVEADVGVSVPGSTTLAKDASAIILTGQNLEGLLVARKTGKQAEKTLKGCFKAGVGINSGLMLAATAGLLKPVSAALIHNMTTFSILGISALISKRSPQI